MRHIIGWLRKQYLSNTDNKVSGWVKEQRYPKLIEKVIKNEGVLYTIDRKQYKKAYLFSATGMKSLDEKINCKKVKVLEAGWLYVFTTTKTGKKLSSFLLVEKFLVLLKKLLKLILKGNRFYESIVLIDRIESAGDNAEYLFRYLIKNGRNSFFVIKKEAPDYERLKKEFGRRIVEYNPLLWYLISFLAKKVLSSNMTGTITLSTIRNRFPNLNIAEFIFLQHGVIKDYLPSINRCFVNSIICSCERERQSLLGNNYLFVCQEILKSGLPRFDFYNKVDNKSSAQSSIIIMPTWRLTEVGAYIPGTNSRAYVQNFKTGKFYKSWSQAIKLVKKKFKSRKLYFILHPMLEGQRPDFEELEINLLRANEIVDILPTAKLFLTDYSSVAMDAAMLGAQVIYFQFDQGLINRTHTYKKGYFDYVEDGFGPVATTLSELKKVLEDGKSGDKYFARASIFFEKKYSACEKICKELL